MLVVVHGEQGLCIVGVRRKKRRRGLLSVGDVLPQKVIRRACGGDHRRSPPPFIPPGSLALNLIFVKIILIYGRGQSFISKFDSCVLAVRSKLRLLHLLLRLFNFKSLEQPELHRLFSCGCCDGRHVEDYYTRRVACVD